MFRTIKRIFHAFAALCQALEKTAKSLDNIATVAEKMSEDLVTEQRRKLLEKSIERRRQLRHQLALEDAKVNPAQSSRQTSHAVTQIDSPPEGMREIEAVRPAAETQATQIGERCSNKILDTTTGANRSCAFAEVLYAQTIERAGGVGVAMAEESQKTHILPQGRDDSAPLGNIEARAIQELVAHRGIQYLVHFTREANLPSILKRGVVTRDVLCAEGLENCCNDRYRLDRTDAVCASIGFPNYKMFFSLRQENKNVDWILLAIDPSILWMTPVAFCAANAASKVVTEVPLEKRMGLAAMEAMFADFGDKTRAALGLPESFPTNPQAEVLLLDGVPKRYIGGAIALNEAQKARIEAKFEGLKVIVDASSYQWRCDYEHWR